MKEGERIYYVMSATSISYRLTSPIVSIVRPLHSTLHLDLFTYQIHKVEGRYQNGAAVAGLVAIGSRSAAIEEPIVAAVSRGGIGSCILIIITITTIITIHHLLPRFDRNPKYRVTSRTPLVHPRAGHVTILLPRKQRGDEPLQIGHDRLVGVDEDTPPGIFPDGQDVAIATATVVAVAGSIVGGHEVADLLVVDFDEGDADQEDAVGGVGGDVAEDVLGRHVEDAAIVDIARSGSIVDAAGALHGVRLTAARLAVRKDRAVQSRHDRADDVPGRVGINVPRGGLLAKHLVEREEVAILDPFRQWFAVGGGLGDGVVLLQRAPDPAAVAGTGGGFAGVERPHADGDWMRVAIAAMISYQYRQHQHHRRWNGEKIYS